jgi:hypothetical protein
VVPNRYGDIYEKDEAIIKCIQSCADDWNVMLMGASIVGRWYLEIARQMGKVALDVGKVLEAWVQPEINQKGARMFWLDHKYSRWVNPRPAVCDFEMTPEGELMYEKYL